MIQFILFLTLSSSAFANGLICKNLSKKIEAQMQGLNQCETDSDCIIEPIHVCPFGCYVFKNKNIDTTKLQSNLKKFSQHCQTCVYRCAQPPKTLKCIENICNPG
jgi:hypothetical protein